MSARRELRYFSGSHSVSWGFCSFAASPSLWAVPDYARINREGGWGFLLAGGLFAAIAAFVCVGCAVRAAVSLMRREKHRPLMIALLIASSLVIWTFRGVAVKVVRGLVGLNAGATNTVHTVERGE
jgi:hypothetical protein